MNRLLFCSFCIILCFKYLKHKQTLVYLFLNQVRNQTFHTSLDVGFHFFDPSLLSNVIKGFYKTMCGKLCKSLTHQKQNKKLLLLCVFYYLILSQSSFHNNSTIIGFQNTLLILQKAEELLSKIATQYLAYYILYESYSRIRKNIFIYQKENFLILASRLFSKSNCQRVSWSVKHSY